MSTSPRPVRLTREQSQAQTRARLLEAARREVAQKGAGASVRDIAEAAGYTQGALYAQFESKEMLLLELLRGHMEREIGELERLLATDAPGGVRAALDGWLGQMNSDLDWSLLAMELQLLARRDAVFAKHYDKLFADHRAAMGRLVERLFKEEGRKLPASGEEIAGALMALAHGLVLQRKPIKRGASDPAGGMIRLVIRALLALGNANG